MAIRAILLVDNYMEVAKNLARRGIPPVFSRKYISELPGQQHHNYAYRESYECRGLGVKDISEKEIPC